MKPIIEARAKTAMLEGKNQHSSPSPISDEATFNIFTGVVTVATPPVEPAPPIRTDAAVASLANLGKDTIRKIEQIENEAAPEL